MEEQYLFETEKFGLSEKSIHLLRNRYNYKTLEIKQIESITIKNGKDLKNWCWVLCVGLMLVFYAIYDVLDLLFLLNDDKTSAIYIERLLIPLFPFLLGIYSVIISIRNTKIMKVNMGNERYHFSLRKISKSDQYDEFISQIRKLFKNIKIH